MPHCVINLTASNSRDCYISGQHPDLGAIKTFLPAFTFFWDTKWNAKTGEIQKGLFQDNY